jgi:hypothetical protein
MPEPNDTIARDFYPLNLLGAHERSISAAEVLEQPGSAFEPEHGVPPRHPGFGKNYVRFRIAANAVGGAGLKTAIRPLRPDNKRRCI